MKRANAEAVAGESEAAALGLPPGEGELAVEALERGGAFELEHPQDYLGIARRRELLAPVRQLATQLDVVVDLAVVDEDRPSAPGLQWLPATGEVDDRQPRRDEPGPGIDRKAVTVGPPVPDRGGHPQERRLVYGRPGPRAGDTANAAHGQPRGSTTTAGAWRYAVATRRRSISA